MKRPTVSGGILFAFLSAVFAAPLWWGLTLVFPFGTALRLVAAASYLAYLVYLVRARRSRIGTVTQVAVNLILSVVLCFFPSSTNAVVFSLTLLLTLNRALLFQRSLFSAALDGLVALAGLMFAGYLANATGSIPTAIWGFLLIQALFVLIPPKAGSSLESGRSAADADPFVRSQRQAEAALERLIKS